jgi:hypothetical protein
MSTITTLEGSDRLKDSRAVINTNFGNLNTDLAVVEADIVTLEALAPTAGQKAALAGDGGTPSDSNRYVLEDSDLFGDVPLVAGETINGATTPVPVYQNKADNELYACDANDDTRYKFIGFAVSNSTNGNPILFKGSGVVGGFTGLQEGEKYYVQDTVGTIGTTPGSQQILVGVAISTTQLLIQKGIMRASGDGTSLGTASGSLPVTCGFRPSLIRLYVRGVGTGEITMLDATWANGVLKGVSSATQSGWVNIDNNLRLYRLSSAVDYMTFSITSVTDTGFTVSWTETGTFTGTSGFYWEAEGEL